MTQYFVGIDLHKSVVQVCVVDDQGEVVEERRLSTDASAHAEEVLAFLSRWKERGRFVVEALGVNRWLVNDCRAAGLDIVVADPCKLGLRTLGKKTDRRDARELARRLRLGDIDEYALTYYPSDEEYGQRKLIRTRHRLVQIRQQLVNHIRGLLNAYRIRPPYSALFLKGARAWLRTCRLPVEELTRCLQALVSTLDGVQQQIEVLSKRVGEPCGVALRRADADRLREPEVAGTVDLGLLGAVRPSSTRPPLADAALPLTSRMRR